MFNKIISEPLPVNYLPRSPERFKPQSIFLTKGSLSSREREKFVQKICALYPAAKIIECLDTSHNRIELKAKDELKRHQRGKQTLVFGQHQSPVRFSEEEGNACPNYWHFSPYGFCFYDCKYCYLAGTTSFWHSPAVRIYLNLEEILAKIDRVATQLAKPTAFYLGKLQDGLALDPLTGYSTILVPFFARHKFARQIILTKSAEVENLLDLDHKEHTILSFSLNPPEITEGFEENTPAIEERIKAMQRCAEKGYLIRAVLMPIIPVENWEEIYQAFLERLLSTVSLQRLTLGGICIYPNAQRLMEQKLGRQNEISSQLDWSTRLGDGRRRYPRALRVRIYQALLQLVRKLKPELEIALCLEDASVWSEVGLERWRGACNCLL